MRAALGTRKRPHKHTPRHPHIAHVYLDPHVLVRSIADFMLEGVRLSEPMLMIATEERRLAVADEIRVRLGAREGTEVAKQIAMFDAADTLKTFMVKGMPDEDLFDGNVGRIVRKACKGVKRLRAYGEMVDLLCGEGNVRAMIRLEEMWNALGAKHSFTLLCAYDRENLTREGRDAFNGVRATHNSLAELVAR